MSEEHWVLWTLAELMRWSDDESYKEFKWLQMMARIKYDGYQDYVAGMRFLPTLVAWLQQFKRQTERLAAYEFVKRRLLYVSPAELQRLVELFFLEHVHHALLKEVAESTGVPTYRFLVDDSAHALYKRRLRQTLFLGLSDGARLDIFRRANVGVVANDQVVVASQLDEHKWQDLLKDLRKSLHDPVARFRTVFLIDDFTASGTSLLRKRDGIWKGKLARFLASIEDRTDCLESEWELRVHHYIAGPGALDAVREQDQLATAERGEKWHSVARFSASIELPPSVKITAETDSEVVSLAKDYYNPSFETSHTEEGGSDVSLGFAACALPLVLDHNTPNNSILLLWGDTQAEGHQGPLVRPLFRRRQRHT